MPEALLLAPVAEAAVGAASIDAIVTGSFVTASGLGGTSILASIGASFLGKAAFSLGISIGVNYLSSLLKSQPVQKSDSTIKQALPARFIDVGRTKSAGCLFWYESPTQFFYVGKIITCDRITEIEQVWLNDTLMSYSGSLEGVATSTNGPWEDNVVVEARLGTVDQSISSLLAGGFNELAWPDDYRLAGLPWIISRYKQVDQKKFMEKYPNGAPETAVVGKMASCPDPRNPAHDLRDPQTWTWTDNAACVILRYLVDVDGWDLDPDDIDIASFQEAADHCDQGVPTTSSVENRYRIWGRYTATQDRSSVVKAMLETCDGRLIEGPDGKAYLYVGVSRAPTVKLTDDDFISIRIEPFGDPLDRVGIIQPRCVLESQNWQEQPVPQVALPDVDPSAAAEIEDMPLQYCPSEYQAQRLAWIRLHQLSPEWTITGVCNLGGLRSFGERVVRVVHTELGIDQTFEVTGYGLNLTDFTYPIKLQSIAPGMYDMAANRLQDLPTIPSPPSVAGLPPPSNIAATYDDAASPPDIDVTWDDDDTFTYELQYRIFDTVTPPEPEDGWEAVDVTGAGTQKITDVPAYPAHQVRMRTLGTRSASAWSAPVDVEEP